MQTFPASTSSYKSTESMSMDGAQIEQILIMSDGWQIGSTA